jgi:5'(3')-deoxyribonucleotidase
MDKIIIDCDSTLNNLIPVWVDIYNKTYCDNLYYQNITTYAIEEYVKPEYREQMFELLGTPGLFSDMVEPVEDSERVVQLLSNHYEIYIFTNCYTPYVANQKRIFFEKYFPFIKQENIFTPLDKRDIYKNNDIFETASYMIDDYEENFKGFKGTKILFSQPHNFRSVLKSDVVRMPSWNNILMFFAIKNKDILNEVIDFVTNPDNCEECREKIDIKTLMAMNTVEEMKPQNQN